MRVFYHTTRGKRLNGVEFGQRLSFIDLLKLRDGDVILFDRISSYLCYFFAECDKAPGRFYLLFGWNVVVAAEAWPCKSTV